MDGFYAASAHSRAKHRSLRPLARRPHSRARCADRALRGHHVLDRGGCDAPRDRPLPRATRRRAARL